MPGEAGLARSRCAALARAGVLPRDRRSSASATQLGALAAFADPEALAELAVERLAPLAGLTPVGARSRLEATLLALAAPAGQRRGGRR